MTAAGGGPRSGPDPGTESWQNGGSIGSDGSIGTEVSDHEKTSSESTQYSFTRPASMRKRRLSSTAPGWVKSTTT